MAERNPKLDPYFDKTSPWQSGICALRQIILDTPLEEELKWRAPCYSFEGQNIAMIWRMKESFGMSFFRGVLLKDEHNILVMPGANSRSARYIKFTKLDEVAPFEDVIKAYIDEAIQVEKAGLKVVFAKDDLEAPEELIQSFDDDPLFQEAFDNLTPGRRRGYILYFSSAKQSKTRYARIEKYKPKILEGKGMHDR